MQGHSEPAPPPPTTEEIDIARHREITSKAVSAILVLLLKWFKTSRKLMVPRCKLMKDAMKGHYFAQLLFDSNCLLLVLKMFGLSDVYVAVQTKNEEEDLKCVYPSFRSTISKAHCSLFRYCHTMCSKGAGTEDYAANHLRRRSSSSEGPHQSPKLTKINDQEVYLVHDYSWRNFFSTINFLKVLQKMTKHRLHRTFVLAQYKASVCAVSPAKRSLKCVRDAEATANT